MVDTLAIGEACASEACLRIVLSKDFHVQARFMDAMTLVTQYGKADYFVTMTCNPYFLIKKGHLRKVAAYAHVTEFQKRGLPNEHFLLVMET